jgi:copper chaperone
MSQYDFVNFLEKEGLNMEKTILNVEGMSCEHCVKAVTNAVSALSGVGEVKVDLDTNTVTVSYQNVSLDSIKEAIEEEGYQVVA